MTKRWFGLSLCALIALLSYLVLTIPASQLIRACAASNIVCSFTRSDGTVWDGRWSGVTIARNNQGVRLSSVGWHVSLLSLISLKPELRLEVESDQGKISALIVQQGEQFIVTDVLADLTVVQPMFSAQVVVNAPYVLADLSGVQQVDDARVGVFDLRVNTGNSVLEAGAFSAVANGTNEAIEVQVRDGGGPIGASGDCRLFVPNYECSLLIDISRLSDDNIRRGLESVASPLGNGQYQFDVAGRF
ncbi:MAG: type II secretion system protein N [Gammaproteobacteria bacterium]|nr:type II secretion system protein N [Gammaproteobacteria bacterium]